MTTISNQRMPSSVPMRPLTPDSVAGDGSRGQQVFEAAQAAPALDADPSTVAHAFPVAGADTEVARTWQILAEVATTSGDGVVTVVLWCYNRHISRWSPTAAMEVVTDPTTMVGATLTIPGILGASHACFEIRDIADDDSIKLTMTPGN